MYIGVYALAVPVATLSSSLCQLPTALSQVRRADEHQSADRLESAHLGTPIQKYADLVTGSALFV